MLTCIFCGQEKLRAERRMGFHYYFCHNCNTTIGWGIPSSVSEGAVETLYKAALSGSPSVPAFPVFDWKKLPIEIYLSDEYIKKAWQEWESSLLNT